MAEEIQKLPGISILMAIYDPKMDWLRQQLDSLNAQTYPNLRLYIRDDASPHVPHGEIQALADECITKFPYSICRNEENLGSNLTFQRLTEEAEGELFAYCDQDDVWLPEKLTVLEQAMEREKAQLVCSDMLVMDGEGHQIADSITKVHRHHVFHSGDDLAKGLLTHNFVTGCTMLAEAEMAKAAVPFCPHMVHDQYLALYCACHGSVYSCLTPTIRYRLHGANQTTMMAGVRNKQTYKEVRIDGSIRKFQWLLEKLPCDDALRREIEQHLEWMQARGRYWETGRGIWDLWRYRKCGKKITLFDSVAAHLPEGIFMWLIGLNRKNVI